MTSKKYLTIGGKKSQRHSAGFDELFRYQFVLAKGSDVIPETWNQCECAGWILGHGSALRVHEILDSRGQLSGYLLGIAWSADGLLVSGAVTLDLALDSDGFPQLFETFAMQLGGRFIALMLTQNCARLYGDPASDFSWVYDPKHGIVGSGVSVVASYPLQPNPEFHLRSLLNGKTVTSFQHTIDRRILRGLSNHYLDLNTFTLHRSWPSADFHLVNTDVDDACNRIAEKLTLILGALTNAFPCILPVTGGHDSRILLACGTGFLSNFAEFSGYRFHNPTRTDTRLGKGLVNDLGQEYRIYYKAPTKIAPLRDFRLKTGWACTRKELAALSMLEQYPYDAVVLRGGILDMLRANQWRTDRIDRPPHIRYGMKRLRLRDGTREEIYKRWRPAYAAWLETLPSAAQSRCYDFAFIEHWLPHTLGAYYLGFHRNFFLNPFNDRELIGLAIGISPSVRKNEVAVRKVIRAASSKLPIDKFH